jgi:AraC-like DNA-binding protein/mannose-6-phosphate isomerase-like protein (cupin superfamily)
MTKMSMSKNSPIPGARPHSPPSVTEQQRILSLTPYVREAQESRRPAWHIKPRRLFDFLIVHWIEGSGALSFGDRHISIQSGDLIWIPPNTLHEMRGHAPSSLLQFIHFDLYYNPNRSHWGASIPGGAEDLSLWPHCMHPPVSDPILRKWCGKIHEGNSTTITETMRRIILEMNRARESNLMVSGLVNQLISHLLNQQNRESAINRYHTQTMERAMQQIQLHGHEKINIKSLASQHGLSPTHFRKLFREYYQQSPHAAHIKIKMREACDCLIFSGLTVSEIADRLGFTNVHNFSRAFRNSVGRSPSAYRAEHAARG